MVPRHKRGAELRKVKIVLYLIISHTYIDYLVRCLLIVVQRMNKQAYKLLELCAALFECCIYVVVMTLSEEGKKEN